MYLVNQVQYFAFLREECESKDFLVKKQERNIQTDGSGSVCAVSPDSGTVLLNYNCYAPSKLPLNVRVDAYKTKF